MKKPVLVLLVLLSVLSFAQAAVPGSNPAATPAPETTAQFLATLSGGQIQSPNELTPAPSFMAGCTSNSECATGELCCYVCGNPPADGDDGSCRACVTPIRGRCPMVI